jgi:hypothetical protein
VVDVAAVNGDESVTFELAIQGENLPSTKSDIKDVILEAKDPTTPITGTEVISSDGKEVLIRATVHEICLYC